MRILESENISYPIEGFFIKSVDDLIFDVKGLSHPQDRIISFVRYVPAKFYENTQKSFTKGYSKLYDLLERYAFLHQNFPQYIYEDPMGQKEKNLIH